MMDVMVRQLLSVMTCAKQHLIPLRIMAVQLRVKTRSVGRSSGPASQCENLMLRPRCRPIGTGDLRETRFGVDGCCLRWS